MASSSNSSLSVDLTTPPTPQVRRSKLREGRYKVPGPSYRKEDLDSTSEDPLNLIDYSKVDFLKPQSPDEVIIKGKKFTKAQAKIYYEQKAEQDKILHDRYKHWGNRPRTFDESCHVSVSLPEDSFEYSNEGQNLVVRQSISPENIEQSRKDATNVGEFAVPMAHFKPMLISSPNRQNVTIPNMAGPDVSMIKNIKNTIRFRPSNVFDLPQKNVDGEENEEFVKENEIPKEEKESNDSMQNQNSDPQMTEDSGENHHVSPAPPEASATQMNRGEKTVEAEDIVKDSTIVQIKDGGESGVEEEEERESVDDMKSTPTKTNTPTFVANTPQTPNTDSRPVVVTDIPPPRSGYVNRTVKRFEFVDDDEDNLSRTNLKSQLDESDEEEENESNLSENESNLSGVVDEIESNKSVDEPMKYRENKVYPKDSVTIDKNDRSTVGEDLAQNPAELVDKSQNLTEEATDGGTAINSDISDVLFNEIPGQKEQSLKNASVLNSSSKRKTSNDLPSPPKKSRDSPDAKENNTQNLHNVSNLSGEIEYTTNRRRVIVDDSTLSRASFNPVSGNSVTFAPRLSDVKLTFKQFQNSQASESHISVGGNDVTAENQTHISYRSTLLGPSIIIPDPELQTPNVRRGKRARVPRLNGYLNQHAVYKTDQDGNRELLGVTAPKIRDKKALKYGVVDPVKIFQAEKRHEKFKPRGVKAKGVKRRVREDWMEDLPTQNILNIPDKHGNVESRVGTYKLDPQATLPTNKHKHTMVFVVNEGAVKVKIADNNSVTLGPEGIFTVPRGVEYSVDNIVDRETRVTYIVTN